ncbi:MAG: ABC transporter substrate-binding protein [Chloroflexota bacterium]
MRRKNLFLVVSLLTVLGLLLVSCAPTVAPTPTPKPAAPAAKPAAPTAKPAAPAPTKAPAPAATKAPAAAPTPKPAAPAPSPKPAGDQPRYGGILTTAMYADMPSFDVHQENTFLTQCTAQPCYNNVIYYDPQDPEKIIGDLAEKWEVSSDGLTYTFHFRKGVKFHDGTPFTAEDAKLSLERLYDPPKGIRSPLQDFLRAIGKVEASDKDTLKVTLKFQYAPFLDAMALGQMVMYPKHVVEAKGHMKNDIVGTGPFKLKDYASGVYFEVVKNPDYFIKGRPYLDGIKMYLVKDDGTRLATFRTGQVKFLGPLVSSAGIKPSQARVIEKEMPQAKIYRFNALSSRWLDMVTNKPPFNDVRLRQAVSIAIDRQTAIKVLLDGEGEIGAQFSPSQWSIPKEELGKRPGYRQPKDADIAQAKKLLAEAGFPNGLKTRILARANYTEDVALYCKDQLSKIGIELELVVRESSVFLSLLNELVFETVSQPMGLRTADPDYLARFYHSKGATPWMGLNDKTIDDLFAKEASAMDPAERKKYLRQMEDRLLELAPNVILFWANGIMASWPEVRNFKPGISIYNNNKYADVWLAK